jgi:hypothetical protein
MHKLSHNKKRNVGLAYEFLSREVAAAAVARDNSRAARALAVMSEHLSDGSPLFPHLSLHRQVMGTRGVSERLARRIVDELKAAGIRSAPKRALIESSKSALIHEMNRQLGRDIFDRFRIPDYTAHASIGVLIGRGLDGRLEEGIELARVEDHLIGFLVSEASGALRYDPDASLYAYRTAIGLFEQQFGHELMPEQAEILREYVRVALGGNPAPFERAFERQRSSLREVLRARRADEVFKADPEMASRLDEAIADLTSLPTRADDESVERLMLYHNLQREIES